MLTPHCTCLPPSINQEVMSENKEGHPANWVSLKIGEPLKWVAPCDFPSRHPTKKRFCPNAPPPATQARRMAGRTYSAGTGPQVFFNNIAASGSRAYRPWRARRPAASGVSQEEEGVARGGRIKGTGGGKTRGVFKNKTPENEVKVWIRSLKAHQRTLRFLMEKSFAWLKKANFTPGPPLSRSADWASPLPRSSCHWTRWSPASAFHTRRPSDRFSADGFRPRKRG